MDGSWLIDFAHHIESQLQKVELLFTVHPNSAIEPDEVVIVRFQAQRLVILNWHRRVLIDVGLGSLPRNELHRNEAPIKIAIQSEPYALDLIVFWDCVIELVAAGTGGVQNVLSQPVIQKHLEPAQTLGPESYKHLGSPHADGLFGIESVEGISAIYNFVALSLGEGYLQWFGFGPIWIDLRAFVSLAIF